MAFNIADLVEHAVDAVPGRLALVCGGQRRTYAELEARANRAAHALARAGVEPGEHVGIYAENSAEWVEAMLACFKLRAVPVNVNYRYVDDELRYLFDDADLVGVLHDPGYGPRLDAIAADLPLLRFRVAFGHAYEEAIASESPDRDFGTRSADDRYVLYTGGTTGMPKGVLWRQEDVFMALGQGISSVTGHQVAHDRELADAAADHEPMVLLSTFPLMHGAAQWGVLACLAAGNTAVILPRFAGDAVWDLVESTGAHSVVIAGDAMGRPMVEALEANPGRWDLSTLLAISSSGALFSVAVKERLFAQLPDLLVSEAVGSSEGGFSGMATFGRDDPTGGAAAGWPG